MLRSSFPARARRSTRRSHWPISTIGTGYWSGSSRKNRPDRPRADTEVSRGDSDWRTRSARPGRGRAPALVAAHHGQQAYGRGADRPPDGALGARGGPGLGTLGVVSPDIRGAFHVARADAEWRADRRAGRKPPAHGGGLRARDRTGGTARPADGLFQRVLQSARAAG